MGFHTHKCVYTHAVCSRMTVRQFSNGQTICRFFITLNKKSKMRSVLKYFYEHLYKQSFLFFKSGKYE